MFHKGELQDGKVSSHRELSTGTDRSSVEALERPGTVHEYQIPQSVLQRWRFEGKVRTFRDYDQKTRVYNDELRFDPSLANELNKYRVPQ